MRNVERLALVAMLAALTMVGTARGQATDAALRDRVDQLLTKLEAPKPEARKSAEDALIKLGPRILPLLPESKGGDGEKEKQIERIREALREALDQTNLGASKITLQGKGIRLTEVLQKLQSQSGNMISDLRESEGSEVTNPGLDLDLQDVPFFQALDEVARQAEVTPNYYTGDGSVGLMAGKPPEKGLVQYAGPFRIAFKQVSSVRDLQAGTSTANTQFEVAWEPRLRPMLLALKADELKIVDDQGRKVEPQVMMESTDVVLRPENPAAEMNVNLVAPERTAKNLASLKVKADVTVPAGLKTFRFPSLAKENVTMKAGDISMTLEGTEVDEQVWKVNVVLEYPGGGEAFESYRQGLFNNRIWLQKKDGSRFEHNGGFSNTSSDQGKLGFEYLFVDAPGKPEDYQLVYETPSKVLTIPLEFEFKDVPLP
ncbi:hypothetical protein [Singulisphaera sp. PoT]|uniref:hypothetical protein n=1 Tax=Singulisphaera sp. PoT TaxID=3411797 RepID=UPI003BF564C2